MEGNTFSVLFFEGIITVLLIFGSTWPEVVKKEQGGRSQHRNLPPSSYFATSSESSRSTFDTSPHSFS